MVEGTVKKPDGSTEQPMTCTTRIIQCALHQTDATWRSVQVSGPLTAVKGPSLVGRENIKTPLRNDEGFEENLLIRLNPCPDDSHQGPLRVRNGDIVLEQGEAKWGSGRW